MLDRIDLHIETPAVPFEKLEGEGDESSEEIRARVASARAWQEARFKGLAIRTNAEMGLREIKQFIPVTKSLHPVLKLAHERHRLSARAYHRVLKIARTVADLAGAKELEGDHLLEALQYRPKLM